MIGVFDSGSGGLTVLKEIHKEAPHLDVVYFGDLLNVPYGEKTAEELGALTTVAIEKLLSEGADNIVSACNSVSAGVAQPLIDLLGRNQFGMIEMVAPTAEALSHESQRDKKFGLVGTHATVRSGMYTKAFAKRGVSLETFPVSGLVEAIENREDEKVIEQFVEKALIELSKKGCDSVILGCTQYPLVENVFKNVANKIGGIDIVNPARFVAKEVLKRFGNNGSGKLRFIISKDSDFFRNIVKEFFGDCEIEVL